MTVLQRIQQLFDKSGIAYELSEHEPVRTSHDAARVRNTELSQGAKALVFYADKKPILLVVPGHKMVELKKVKRTFDIKDLRMATHDQVLHLTGVEVGAVPPVGKVLNLNSYYDNWFSKSESVAFNPGSHTHSIVMKTKDLIKVEQPKFADICKDEIM